MILWHDDGVILDLQVQVVHLFHTAQFYIISFVSARHIPIVIDDRGSGSTSISTTMRCFTG